MSEPAARSLDEWLRLQERLHPRSIELGLGRVRAVAQRLALPAKSIFTLAIAGTNGKGSSAHLAAGIYRAAGYSTGLYTSPHLLHYTERVQIDGAPVSEVALCRAFAAIEAARGEISLTYFEYGTLAALWLFREAGVQVQVLEVGLGGRLDAVNLVDADVALITNVGLDHQDYLGPDRESIGREKAGILRSARPAVLVERAPPDSVSAAAQTAAPALRLGRDFDYERQADGRWCWQRGETRLRELPAPGLPGAIQYQNAAGVIAAVLAGAASRPVAEEAIRKALPQLRLRGRCEIYRGLLLDVAHNLESAQVLAQQLAAQPRPRVLLLGMLSDKPVAAVAQCLAPHLQRILTVGLPGPRGLSAAALAQQLQAAGIAAQGCENMAEALQAARAALPAEGQVLVAGSFLTVAAAIEELDRHG
ncbi:dihydrofolate synthase / folylpolyglutamate synthase [Solimonas aquatica]|uniref:Dihydrofolate synthase/folylpolyglutamate synthase n=1 Tax=Solimonas aquatica TaxID=489703 RepID=A0A1H8ZZU9_9GAMM|nr:bifunctional tetrahydrofolate synthase/dihydrofolate synthase [Solimonas aquatica]SEP70002.1 dihydrofolate synthase / folylpolyglutamate synthase [Solimonas aquatica]